VLAAVFFFVCFYWAPYFVSISLRTVFLMLLSGLVLVGVAVALGG
jgi:hypothetical protein